MKNIVFYVHRTGLLGYFVNPICSFLKDKYQITVLHLDKRNGYSSYGNGDYRMIDLSNYSVEETQQTLKAINPEAVIFLGFISIYELMLIRLVTDLGFSTIYLEHGIYAKETASLPLAKIIYNFKKTASKNLFFLRQYRNFIKKSSKPKLEKSLFKQCVIKKNYQNSKFSKALFFSDYGYRQVDKLFQYDRSNVDFTCYPLTYDNVQFNELKRISAQPLSDNNRAILIHQPFILDGLANWGYEKEREYFTNTANEIGKFGYELTILVHPRESKKRYEELYKATAIKICQNIEKAGYKNYSLAIGHYSTALLYPVFMNIPMMIVGYGDKVKAADSTFHSLNCQLPITDFSSIKQKYADFCKEYIGTSNCSFENMASVIDKTISLL